MEDYDAIYNFGVAPASVNTGLISMGQLMPTRTPPTIGDLGGPIDIGGLPGGVGSGGAGSGGIFGLNLDTAKLGLRGLATIGNLWAATQANKLAKKQFDMAKKVGQANLTNSIQSYNTMLEDRLSSRGKVEGTSADDVAAAIAANRLKNVNL